MEKRDPISDESLFCHAGDCSAEAIVLLAGRPLCDKHYLQNLNQLNALVLTPRGIIDELTAPPDAMWRPDR